jgi:hypothetical protein
MGTVPVSGEALLRLLMVPAVVWVASLAARRWGHAVSGDLGGLPFIGGPITIYHALDHGAEFAARSAMFTLVAIVGQAAHLLAFAHSARRGRWWLSLAAGWAAFVAASIAASMLPMSPLVALALALAGLALAWRYLPRAEGAQPPPLIPAAELWLRLAAAFTLAAFIVGTADAFGPVVSGILLSLPITGSIIPPFTLALYGPQALARLMRGFVIGLTGFTAFFFVVSATLPTWGIAASFVTAVTSALAAVFTARYLSKRAMVRS